MAQGQQNIKERQPSADNGRFYDFMLRLDEITPFAGPAALISFKSPHMNKIIILFMWISCGKLLKSPLTRCSSTFQALQADKSQRLIFLSELSCTLIF